MTAALIATTGAAVVAVAAAVSAVVDARRCRRYRDHASGAEWRAAVSLARIRQREDHHDGS